jgi:hypothetical protein
MLTNYELSLARASSRPPVGILILYRTLHCSRLAAPRAHICLFTVTVIIANIYRHRIRTVLAIIIGKYQNKIDFRYLKPIYSLNIKLLKISRKHMVVLSRIGELIF